MSDLTVVNNDGMKIFENSEFGKIRIVEYNNQPYFIAKDIADILHLENFAGQERMKKIIAGQKAFIAAFSLNGKEYKRIFDYIINSEVINPLLKYPELYLIGIEVCQ